MTEQEICRRISTPDAKILTHVEHGGGYGFSITVMTELEAYKWAHKYQHLQTKIYATSEVHQKVDGGGHWGVNAVERSA